MNDLVFITDKGLRQTLEDSIEFIPILYIRSRTEKNKLYREETYRITILYVISCIEAVLLYTFKERGEKFEYSEYKFTAPLSPKFEHSDRKGLPIVVAVQEKIKKEDHQIGLHDLVNFFKDNKLIDLDKAEEILELNDVRNTFHFSKPRLKSCDIKQVNAAINLLIYIIETAPKILKK